MLYFNMPMNAEYNDVMNKLIKIVTRMFYEPHHVVIADILLENILLSDVEMCEKMKMLSREFNKLINKLKEDHLVKYDVKVEVQEDNRQFLRTVYYFNYAEVRDVVKYKVYKMTRALEEKMKVVEESFKCPGCERVFSALDAQSCMEGFVFKCIFCKTALIENIVQNDNTGIDLKGLMMSLEQVISLLKEADTYKIPSLDYFQVLEIKKAREEASNNTEPVKKPEEDAKALEIAEEADAKNFEDDEFEEENTFKNRVEEEQKIEYVFAGGKKIKYSEITDEDLENMDEAEYTKYYEIHSKYN